MATVDDLRSVLNDYPQRHANDQRFADLREFLAEMKAAGIATTREYDLPRADTVGRVATNSGARNEVVPRSETSSDR